MGSNDTNNFMDVQLKDVYRRKIVKAANSIPPVPDLNAIQSVEEKQNAGIQRNSWKEWAAAAAMLVCVGLYPLLKSIRSDLPRVSGLIESIESEEFKQNARSWRDGVMESFHEQYGRDRR